MCSIFFLHNFSSNLPIGSKFRYKFSSCFILLIVSKLHYHKDKGKVNYALPLKSDFFGSRPASHFYFILFWNKIFSYNFFRLIFFFLFSPYLKTNYFLEGAKAKPPKEIWVKFFTFFLFGRNLCNLNFKIRPYCLFFSYYEIVFHISRSQYFINIFLLSHVTFAFSFRI